MLVKKVGGILLFKLKLYKLIKTLTLPLIIISLLLPFTEWNFIQSRQKYEFQEPSLRTKIFDLNFEKSTLNDQIFYQKLSSGIKYVSFQGRLNNQCILITYPQNFQQSVAAKILHQTLKNDKNLAKNVVVLSYRNTKDLRDLFDKYSKGQKSLNFGTIRVALNIDNQIRSKQKSKTSQMKAFLQIFGKEGIRCDVDHFQSLKQILQRLHIEWSPCQEIYEKQVLKDMRKSLSHLNSYIPGTKSRISLFLDHILCQGYRSFTYNYEKSHEILIQNGFQSSSVTFLMNQMTTQKDKKLENAQKIVKFSYSFVKQYSMQEDHLHSSSTFYYPISNHYYLSLMGTIYGGLLFFIVGLVNVIGYIVQNSQNLTSKITIFNLVEIFFFLLELKFFGNIDKTFLYLLIKFILKLIIDILPFFKKKSQKYVSLEYTLLTGVSFLLSLYFSVFNFSLFYLSTLSSSLMLIKNRKFLLAILVLAILWKNFGLDFDTIKSQFQAINLQNLSKIIIQSVQKSIENVKMISLDVKLTIIPFIYGFSTFLN